MPNTTSFDGASFFDPDNFYEEEHTIFQSQRENNTYKFDLSGWENTTSPNSEYLPNIAESLNHTDLVHYWNDRGTKIMKQKLHMAKKLSEWDELEYSFDNFSIGNSPTIGFAGVLFLLKEEGIKRIIFETPYYFAPYYQAIELGFEVIRIPTFYNEGFCFFPEKFGVNMGDDTAVWITQPRYCLGIDNDVDTLRNILSSFGENCYMVIDEATEMKFPSHLGDSLDVELDPVIRIKSFFKGTGINGLRMCAILHAKSLRDDMCMALEYWQGGLHSLSLQYATQIIERESFFQHMLKVSRSEVSNLFRTASEIYFNAHFKLLPLENGYLGAGYIDKPFAFDSIEDFRIKVLEYCVANGLLLMTGNHWQLNRDPNRLFFRINYFRKEKEILEGLNCLNNWRDHIRT